MSAVVAVASFALSACGTGMSSQTAEMVPAVPGVNLDRPGTNNLGTVSVRNAALVYPGTQGYRADSEATANAWLFNNTPAEQLVVIKYEGQEIKRVTIKPGGFDRTELKLKLRNGVRSHDSVKVQFEWVRVTTMDIELPVAPPESPVPAEKLELPAEGGVEGH